MKNCNFVLLAVIATCCVVITYQLQEIKSSMTEIEGLQGSLNSNVASLVNYLSGAEIEIIEY